MAEQILSVALLRELFDYDSDTGILRHKVGMSSRANIGDVAGAPNDRGYLVVGIFGGRYRVHRIVWAIATGAHPEGEIDHRNGNKADNRLTNLRDVSRPTNSQNRRVAQSGKALTSLLGVSFERSSGLWKAQIGIGGKNIHLGRFETDSEAHRAYLEAKRVYHEGCTI